MCKKGIPQITSMRFAQLVVVVVIVVAFKLTPSLTCPSLSRLTSTHLVHFIVVKIVTGAKRRFIDL